MDRLVAVLALLLEVLSQRVEDGARAGARILLVPPELQSGGEQLITVFTAVHLLICRSTQGTWELSISTTSCRLCDAEDAESGM